MSYMARSSGLMRRCTVAPQNPSCSAEPEPARRNDPLRVGAQRPLPPRLRIRRFKAPAVLAIRPYSRTSLHTPLSATDTTSPSLCTSSRDIGDTIPQDPSTMHEARHRPTQCNPRYLHTVRRVAPPSGGHTSACRQAPSPPLQDPVGRDPSGDHDRTLNSQAATGRSWDKIYTRSNELIGL